MVAEKGARIMQIWLGETLAVPDFDLYDKIGDLSSLSIFIEFEYTLNGKILYREQVTNKAKV